MGKQVAHPTRLGLRKCVELARKRNEKIAEMRWFVAEMR
jgi:hypothetical protein